MVGELKDFSWEGEVTVAERQPAGLDEPALNADAAMKLFRSLYEERHGYPFNDNSGEEGDRQRTKERHIFDGLIVRYGADLARELIEYVFSELRGEFRGRVVGPEFFSEGFRWATDMWRHDVLKRRGSFAGTQKTDWHRGGVDDMDLLRGEA